jgi:AraC-like DNA-binding protein
MQRSTSAAEELSEWGHPPHWHESGQFVTAVIGSGVLVIDGREHPFDPTLGVWVPAGVEHAGRFGDDLVPLAVELPDTRMGRAGAVVRVVPIGPELRHALLASTRESAAASERQLHELLASAVSDAPVLREALRIPSGRLTAPVVAHLRATPAHVPPLVEWADRLHTSVATIRRAFLAETGRPYSDWTTLFRLELSIERLVAGEPVGAVARSTGFSVNGYGLAFRRWTGLTPSEFRARAVAAR